MDIANHLAILGTIIALENDCFECDISCDTCSAGTSSDCLACVDGYSKQGDVCVKNVEVVVDTDCGNVAYYDSASSSCYCLD